MNEPILVVEDDVDIRANLAELLSDEGYTVSQVTNGQQALEFLRTTEPLPCVILLDLMMPVMDGLRFREEQRKDPRLAGIPVIVMTADAQRARSREAMDVREWLGKPLDILVLLELLQTVVGEERVGEERVTTGTRLS